MVCILRKFFVFTIHIVLNFSSVCRVLDIGLDPNSQRFLEFRAIFGEMALKAKRAVQRRARCSESRRLRRSIGWTFRIFRHFPCVHCICFLLDVFQNLWRKLLSDSRRSTALQWPSSWDRSRTKIIADKSFEWETFRPLMNLFLNPSRTTSGCPNCFSSSAKIFSHSSLVPTHVNGKMTFRTGSERQDPNYSIRSNVNSSPGARDSSLPRTLLANRTKSEGSPENHSFDHFDFVHLSFQCNISISYQGKLEIKLMKYS